MDSCLGALLLYISRSSGMSCVIWLMWGFQMRRSHSRQKAPHGSVRMCACFNKCVFLWQTCIQGMSSKTSTLNKWICHEWCISLQSNTLSLSLRLPNCHTPTQLWQRCQNTNLLYTKHWHHAYLCTCYILFQGTPVCVGTSDACTFVSVFGSQTVVPFDQWWRINTFRIILLQEKYVLQPFRFSHPTFSFSLQLAWASL